MDTSPNLLLPYIAAAQSQKHVTHNEAIRALDALIQLSVLDKDLAAPPAIPVEGARYIVAASPTGAWSGQATRIAAFQDGAWAFYLPRLGWLAFVADEALRYAFDGAAWVVAGGDLTDPTPKLGINTSSDTTNRLAVASAASLFTHAGSDHRLKLNKSAAAATGSLLFQTAFSGRAEVGLTGDDDLRLKVSADGTTWHDALVVDRTTGAVLLPNTAASGAASINPSLLVNGDFQINQRGFAGGALATGDYGFDRWKAASGGASASLTDFTLTLASGELEQVVETALWGLSSLASTQVAISVEAPSQDLTVTFASASGTIAAGAGRRAVTLTTAVGDTGDLSLKIKRTTAGSVTFGRVKLEVGASATGWQARPIELSLCQRYYYNTQNAAGTSANIVFYGYNIGGATPQQSFSHPVPMRVNPAATRNGTWTASNCSQPSTPSADQKYWSSYVTVAVTSAYACIGNVSGNYMAFNAEF